MFGIIASSVYFFCVCFLFFIVLINLFIYWRSIEYE